MSVRLGSGQSIRLESQTVISWQGQYCCEEEEKSPWFQKLHVRLQDYIPVINVQDFHLYMFRISCHICLGFLVTRMRRISRLSRPIISLLPSLSPPSTPLIICRIIYTSLFKAAIIYQSMLWSQDLLPAPTAFIRARTIHTQCVTCATARCTVFSINALEFVLKPELTIAESASEVAGRNYQQVPLYSCLPMINLINLIRIKPDDCHRLISIWLFDCNLPCALSMQRALWAFRQILPFVWPSDCIHIIP